MAEKMRGPGSSTSGGGRPGINRRVSVFDLGGGSGHNSSRATPTISSPPHRGPRNSLPQAASFSVGSGTGSSGFSPRAPSATGGGGGGDGRSPSRGGAGAGGGGVSSSTPPLHRRSAQPEDPEMLQLLKNQLEQLAMAKEAEVKRSRIGGGFQRAWEALRCRGHAGGASRSVGLIFCMRFHCHLPQVENILVQLFVKSAPVRWLLASHLYPSLRLECFRSLPLVLFFAF